MMLNDELQQAEAELNVRCYNTLGSTQSTGMLAHLCRRRQWRLVLIHRPAGSTTGYQRI